MYLSTKCPYSITKQEIVQFVGRDARIISSAQGYPVHIIMERSTAKTMDCYVEFETVGDAESCIKKLNNVLETGRPPRLGNRHVEVSLSSEDSLLKDLFPRAKCIVWKKGSPHLTVNKDPYSTGFKGFLTTEELLGVIRHAEQPQRVCRTIILLFRLLLMGMNMCSLHSRRSVLNVRTKA